MNIYQKAIKVRKECETHKTCKNCKYFYNCSITKILIFIPLKEKIRIIAKAIKEEKWNVK